MPWRSIVSWRRSSSPVHERAIPFMLADPQQTQRHLLAAASSADPPASVPPADGDEHQEVDHIELSCRPGRGESCPNSS